MPAKRSQYALPPASTRRAPRPSRGWNAVRAYVAATCSRSRASTVSGASGGDNDRSSEASGQRGLAPRRSGDDDLAHAGADGRETGGELRPHAAGHRRTVEQAARLGRVEDLAHASGVVGDPLDV